MHTIIPLLLAHIQEPNKQILFLLKFIVKNIPLNSDSFYDNTGGRGQFSCKVCSTNFSHHNFIDNPMQLLPAYSILLVNLILARIKRFKHRPEWLLLLWTMYFIFVSKCTCQNIKFVLNYK